MATEIVQFEVGYRFRNNYVPILVDNIQFNTLRQRQNWQHFPNDIFKRIFFNENVWISMTISLKFVPKGPVNNIPALVLIMAWSRPGDNPLSEPIMVTLPTHVCILGLNELTFTAGLQPVKVKCYHGNNCFSAISDHKKLAPWQPLVFIDHYHYLCIELI